ncbi:hypothetical protein J2810_002605 [Chryseobacterium rhizosphaerae]|uniref:hypothetical protein n=1 Tax=Chryseobacterium rhizosphaerae TaxID=395937 RepID=UPI002856E0CD|nr:hypothetical protein [Chryseobacterium rhizosphaerae]MDR6546546.1 hypothetical protein [Chryseobacterium rhizosphaerae]
MLKKYKNEVYQIIKEKFNLDTGRFTITDFEERQSPITEIKVIDSEMCFQFFNPFSSWEQFRYRYTAFRPILSISEFIPNNSQILNEDETFKHFENWIRNHAVPFIEEMDSIDRWNNFQFEQNIFTLLDANILDNAPFTTHQIQYITSSTNVLRESIVERINPTEAQMQYIMERLDYLVDATDRLGKFDWYGVFLSTLISIAINMGVDTGTPQVLYELVKQAFSSFKLLMNN